MAYEVGTASNFEDLFTRMVDFLTTDPALVAANQQWEALRLQRDNLSGYTTNLGQPDITSNGRVNDTFRYDARKINTSIEGSENNFYATNFSSGSSQFTMELKQARTVDRVRVGINGSSSSAIHAASVTAFRLQSSPDGNTWTTRLTVTGISWNSGVRQYQTFNLPSPAGPFAHWRVILDNNISGSNISWMSFLLLEDDDTVANHYGSEVLWKAKGNGGTDEIFTGIRSQYNLAAGWYNWVLDGFAGFEPTNRGFFDQPGALYYGNQPNSPHNTRCPQVPLWDSAMPYWFAANGRSFRFGVKVSTGYEGGYLGFILPYATPGQYPYPLAVGGSHAPTGNPDSSWRYSEVARERGVPVSPGGSSTHSTQDTACLFIRDLQGIWRSFVNFGSILSGQPPDNITTMGSTITGTTSGAARGVWPHNQLTGSVGRLPYRDALGGGQVLIPAIAYQREPQTIVYGELEGLYKVTGFNGSAEDIATFAGKDHVILQNTYRTTVWEYWAMSLDA